MQTEIEWQFDAVDVRPVARWLSDWAVRGQGEVTAGPAVRIRDVYLDTDDWRIHRAGYSLRIRHRGREAEATLKEMTGAEPIRRRIEISESADGRTDRPPLDGDGPVAARLRAVCGPRELHPLCEVRTSRHTYIVQAGEARAAVALDETSIPVEDGGPPARLRRVEVEVEEGSPDGLAAFVADLKEGCGLQAAALTKFEAALLSRGLSPPAEPDLGPTAVDPSRTLGEVGFAALRSHFAAFLRTEPGVRIGDDPEEVHDMRVATRRIRAALSIFADALPARSQRFRGEFGWVAASLGAVRDLDVQLGRLRAAEGSGVEGLGPVIHAFEEQRESARRELLRVLDSARFARMQSSFEALLRRGPLRAQPLAWRLAPAVAPALVARRRRSVKKAAKRIDPQASDPSAMHLLRIRCKRLRYCLEFLEGVYPDEIGAVLPDLVRVQDLLGRRQDSIVGSGRLRELLESSGSELGTVAVFAMGRLTERFEQEARSAEGKFLRSYRKLSGPNWRKLQRAMSRAEHLAEAG